MYLRYWKHAMSIQISHMLYIYGEWLRSPFNHCWCDWAKQNTSIIGSEDSEGELLFLDVRRRSRNYWTSALYPLQLTRGVVDATDKYLGLCCVILKSDFCMVSKRQVSRRKLRQHHWVHQNLLYSSLRFVCKRVIFGTLRALYDSTILETL